jgi:LmbE family N-acetylglucosaminyl deacetylase
MIGIEARLANQNILLLSPHPDDIAYSIGGLIAKIASAATLNMVTVFSRSGWANPVALRRAGPASIGAIRTAEDTEFCVRHGIGRSELGFADSSLCGYDDNSERSANPEDDPRTQTVARAIQSHHSRSRAQVVFAPAAIGGHIDHKIVFDAAVSLQAAQIIVYEDIPYSAWYSLQQIERKLTGAKLRRLGVVAIDDVMDVKIEGMWKYRSQTCAKTVEEMKLHARRVATGQVTYAEVLWTIN